MRACNRLPVHWQYDDDWPQKGRQYPAHNFSKVNANGDGSVSIDEQNRAIGANPGVRALFQKLDTNGDGFLSEPELQHSHGVPLISDSRLILI